MNRVLYQISGENGRTLEQGLRPLAAVQMVDPQLSYGSLEADRLSWTVWMRTDADADVVPDLGQKITLYHSVDEGTTNTRIFTGTVTRRQYRADANGPRWNIEVENFWWNLQQMDISTLGGDDAGRLRERTAYVFEGGNVGQHLINLSTLAISLGAQFRIGSMASAFDIPRISIRNKSIAEAYVDLMAWLPDGRLAVDYSEPAGPPKLSLWRRLTTPTYTINLDTQTSSIPSIDLNPRIDLKVDRVKVVRAARLTSGLSRVVGYESTEAGATTDRARYQVTTVTGQEIDTYLPFDFSDVVVVQSAAQNFANMARQYEPRLRGYTGPLNIGQVTLPDFRSGGASNYSGGGFSILYSRTPFGQPTKVVDADTLQPLPANWTRYLTRMEPFGKKDWFDRAGYPVRMAKVTMTIWDIQVKPIIPATTTGLETYAAGYSPTSQGVPAWHSRLGATEFAFLAAEPQLVNKTLYTAELTLTVPYTSELWSSPIPLVKPEDYGFLYPPPDLAANLLAAQNWLSYEGTVEQNNDVPHPYNFTGAALNLYNAAPEHAGMRAMIAGQELDLTTGLMRYRVGAPGRETYLTKVNRFRVGGQDNIVRI